MKRCFGPAPLIGSLLLFAGSGFLIVEILQRHRYDTQEAHLKAALAGFQARCTLAVTDHDEVIPAKEGARSPGKVEIRTDTEDRSYRHRNHYWELDAAFRDADAGVVHTSTHQMFFIALIQRRTLFLHSPQLHVLGRPNLSLMNIFDDILRDHDLTHSATLPPD